jgi:hypothetical protein
MSEADNLLDVKVEAASRLYDRTDPAFLAQVMQLRRDMSTAGVQVLEEELPGRKGGSEIMPIVQAVVAGGPGLLALCGVAKAWLKQRGDRLIRLTVHRADKDGLVLEIHGENVSDETLIAFSKDVSKHLK